MDSSIIIVFLGCLLFGSTSFYWNLKAGATSLKLITLWFGLLGISLAGIILCLEVIKVLASQ